MKKLAKGLIFGLAGYGIMNTAFFGGVIWTVGSLLNNKQFASVNGVLRDMDYVYGPNSVFSRSVVEGACMMKKTFRGIAYKN